MSSSITKSSNTNFFFKCGAKDFWLGDLSIREEPGAMFTEHLKKKDFATSYFFLQTTFLKAGKKYLKTYRM